MSILLSCLCKCFAPESLGGRPAQKKPGYVVANLTITDPERFKAEYASKVAATMKPFEGRYAMKTFLDDIKFKEGPAQMLTVMLEFPSIEKAVAWHDSKAYQKILPARLEVSSPPGRPATRALFLPRVPSHNPTLPTLQMLTHSAPARRQPTPTSPPSSLRKACRNDDRSPKPLLCIDFYAPVFSYRIRIPPGTPSVMGRCQSGPSGEARAGVCSTTRSQPRCASQGALPSTRPAHHLLFWKTRLK